jgi:phosphoserine phosphatase
MAGALDLETVYAKRLQAVRPTRAQINQIRRIYKRNVVEDAAAVIAALQALGHQVYIISGGLAEPVAEFGLYLGVPRHNIRAVNIAYNKLSGTWWKTSDEDVDGAEEYLAFNEGALTISDGKALIVRELLGDQRGRSLLIGDGYSDLLAGRTVDLFVGFGGVAKRERVLAEAPAFVHSASLAPLLVLAAGPAAGRQAQGTPHQAIFQKAIDLVTAGAITFNHERLKAKFYAAFKAAH